MKKITKKKIAEQIIIALSILAFLGFIGSFGKMANDFDVNPASLTIFIICAVWLVFIGLVNRVFR